MMKVLLWGGHFTMNGTEFGTDGIHISLNSLLWPRLSSTEPQLPHEQVPNKKKLISFYFLSCTEWRTFNGSLFLDTHKNIQNLNRSVLNFCHQGFPPLSISIKEPIFWKIYFMAQYMLSKFLIIKS